MRPWPGGRLSSWLTRSANYLICLEEERRGNSESEGLGRLQVEDQLEFHRLLHGQIGGLGTLENLVDISGGTSEQLREACSIGHEATRLREFLKLGHHRQLVRDGEVRNLSAVHNSEGLR